MRLRGWKMAGLGAALLIAGPAGTVVRAPAATADSMVTIQGRGFGHGVGMAQDGAYWMGVSGRSANEILRLFYPGATVAKKAGTVRVALGSGSTVSVGFPSGGRISGTRVPSGRTVAVSVRNGELSGVVSAAPASTTSEPAPSPLKALAFSSGRGFSTGAGLATRSVVAQATDGDGVVVLTTPPTTVAAPPPGAAPPGAVAPPELPDTTSTTAVAARETGDGGPPVVPAGEPTPLNGDDPAGGGSRGGADAGSQAAVTVRGATLEADSSATVSYGGRRYRGVLELRAVAGAVRVVNVVDIEDYLRGMGEILSPSWPAATLQAQAIAARTYALRYMATAGEICPTQRCQVYLGAQAEYPQMDRAVAATRSRVLVYQGKLIAAFYSASGGGTIATPSEAFGGDVDIPYLRAGAYPTGDLKPWMVTMSLGEIARRLGYGGSPSAIAVTDVGPSGRALTVSIYGSSGTLRVRGPAFDAALGLRSTFFTFGAAGAAGGSSGPSDPAGTGGAAAGPVGPRIPMVPEFAPGEGSAGADGSLFGQADLLAVPDPVLDDGGNGRATGSDAAEPGVVPLTTPAPTSSAERAGTRPARTTTTAALPAPMSASALGRPARPSTGRTPGFAYPLGASVLVTSAAVVAAARVRRRAIRSRGGVGRTAETHRRPRRG